MVGWQARDGGRRSSVYALLSLASILSFAAAEGRGDSIDWQEDFSKAQATAKESGRLLILYFSGSDWCLWCKKLEDELFSSDEIREGIPLRAVPLRLDFPQGKRLAPSRQLQNKVLRSRFDVRAFPRVIIYDPAESKALWQHGYLEVEATNYLRQIDRILAVSKEGSSTLD